MNVQLVLICVLCCVGMAGSDAFGTLLNRAINQNRPHLAGAADVGGDFFGRVLLTGYGLTTLTHGHGWQGWAFVAPVLVTGYFTTFYATKKFAHLQVGV